MNSDIDCGKLNEVLESIYNIPVDAAKLEKWVNGGEFETVMLGGKEVPCLRNLVRQIDERSSQAAEEEINEAKAEIGALAEKLKAKIDELKAMTASAETLPPDHPATVYYNAGTGEFEFGIPQGRQGIQGERGLAPAVDIIYGGDPLDEGLSIIYGGNPALDEPGDRTIIRQVARIGTSAQWATANPILEDGETGYERTTDGKLLWKIGDGVTHWNDLLYPSILVDKIYRFRGSVATVDDLPTNAAAGDVYNVIFTGANYAWTGETWDNLGVVQEIDPAPIKDSGNPVASGGVYAALEIIQEAIAATGVPDNVTIIKDAIGKLVAQDIAIGGDPADLASARGQIGTALPVGNKNLNTLTKTGYYITDNNSTNKPHGFSQTAVLVYERKVSNSTRRIYQIAFNSTSTRIKVRRASFDTGLEDAPTSWDEWQDITLSSLFGDGIRVTNGIVSVPEYEGATDTAAGVTGLVPPAAPEEKDKYLKGDGTYGSGLAASVFTPPTASAPGKAGLVPGPGAGKADAYLRGDGTWSLDVSGLEAWRKSLIGAPMMLPSPVLPAGYMWADGTLASFADWPELKEAYQAGKFQGYVLPANASDADKAAYPGKWVLAAKSAGLYTPRLIGLFARYCGQDGAGEYNAPGLPNIMGGWSNIQIYRPSTILGYSGAFTAHAVSSVPTMGASGLGWDGLSFNASVSNGIYGASATVTPESANLPAALYLGKPAEV